MKNKILEIISSKPKHYSVIIKNNKELNQWVADNSLIVSDRYPEMIYSAIHKETNICHNGNRMTIARIADGWIGCGPANICECTKDKISKNVSKTKSELSDEIKDISNKKREETLLKEYGVRFNSQRPEIKKILSKSKISNNLHLLLTNKEWLENEYIIKGRSLSDIADELGIYYGTVGEYCRNFGFKIRQRTNTSREENIICNILDDANISYIKNDWDILQTKEIDIYIPSHKLGIEINGLYWHSFNPMCNHTSPNENKNKHIDKMLLSKSKNIELIQFTDQEVNNKLDIVKSIILTRLGISSKIYARNCLIREVGKKEEKIFIDTNHLQGFSGSSIAFGLYYNNELVSIMTFGKSRFSSKADIELIRFCSKIDHNVLGGAEKLFNYAKKYFKGKSIISYCDLSKFTGKIYSKLGFVAEECNKPGYFWTDGINVISRHKCQHKNLFKWLKGYDPAKSESANLFSAGYRRYWDCGQQSWKILL